MDREYLEDYEQKEQSEYERLLRRIREGKFSFERDRFPPDERFVNLQKPVASLISPETACAPNLWAQVPFCGSLILTLGPFPKPVFEETYFKVSEIPKVVDFIKETGRLQVALSAHAKEYEGFDYLDPFFKELSPPGYPGAPISIFGNEKEIKRAANTFFTLGRLGYLDLLRKKCLEISPRAFPMVLGKNVDAYLTLKLGRYTVAEDIENLMVDDPEVALFLLIRCRKFIVFPVTDLRVNLMNFTVEEIKAAEILPLVYQPQEIRFPCEIGKFLLKKLTHAPQGLRACNELIDEYDAYDLRKVGESLNEGIVANHPDVVNKRAEELSELLDNLWNDPTIPRRVKGLQIGIPLSMAAIGSVAAGPIGAAGGFLAGLGFEVAHKFIDVETTGLSEKLAKLCTKSYQANVYDFKKKYKAKIAHP